MENPPFEDVFPMKNGGFSMAMLDYRRVSSFFGGHVFPLERHIQGCFCRLVASRTKGVQKGGDRPSGRGEGLGAATAGYERCRGNR